MLEARDALRIVADHEGPVVLDLDETTYLRNSTEDHIDSVWPRLPALLLLRALDVVKPWRFTGGVATRDVWRVRAVRTLFPWVRLLWRRRVQGLAERFANRPLIEAARTGGREPYLVTSGFAPVVAPLTAALGFSPERVIAMGVSSAARRGGKLRLAEAALGRELLSRSVAVTDLEDDRPLLDACAVPCLVRWPDSLYRLALLDVYLPGQYLSLVKRPGTRYIWRSVLQEDLVCWYLCSVALYASPLFHLFAIMLLMLSFWAIYETGYVENDWFAAAFETEPQLSEEYSRRPVATPALAPWIWALSAGFLGVLLLHWPTGRWRHRGRVAETLEGLQQLGRPHDIPWPAVAPDLLAWAALLLVLRTLYWVYNRLDKQTRVWLFALLQLFRASAFVVVMKVTLVGTVAVIAHALSRWVPYFAYRYAGKSWPDSPQAFMRLWFFLLLLIPLLEGFGPELFRDNGTFAVLLLWNVFRARKELLHVVRAAHRIDRKGDPPPEAPPPHPARSPLESTQNPAGW
jgi:phosphoserine phosphatase